mmetsp:Transcript_36355/g.109919  ORF Transcript_36355/g.109919 Transcript_36355/m.109919 type:complete len:696 (-) Transcript_36355:781-2868(-)
MGGAPTHADDQVGHGYGGWPNQEGQHQKHVVEASQEVAEDHDPREAERQQENRHEVQDLCGECGDHEARHYRPARPAREERQQRRLGPRAHLVGQAALEQGPHSALLAAFDHLLDLVAACAGAAGDEVAELAQILSDQVPPRERREQDRGDDPRNERDDDQRHRELPAVLRLQRQDCVDQVGHAQKPRWPVVRLPVRHVDVLPRLVLVRLRAACEEVPRDACHGTLLHGRCDVLVLEDEEERGGANAAEHLADCMHRAVLQDHLAQLWHERDEPHRDDPLRRKPGPQGGELPRAEAGEGEEDEQDDVEVNAEVHHQVARVEGDRREVVGERVQQADALAQQVIVPRADHRDAAAGDLGEEVRGRVERGLSAFLELQGVDVRRLLLAHTHVEARENVLAQVDDRRAFAHAAAVPRPEGVQEVRVPVMHADAQAGEEALVNRAEGPLGGCVALADGPLAARVDVLAEPEVAALRRSPVLLVEGHETAKDVRDLEALADERAHVAIERLNVVPRREAQSVQLIARLALGLEVAVGSDPERELARQHLQDAEPAAVFVPPGFHAGLLEAARGVAAPRGQEVLHHPPDLRGGAFLQVEDEVQWVISVLLKQHLHSLIVFLVPFGVPIRLVRQDHLDVVLGDALLRELRVVLPDLRHGRQRAAVVQRADDRLGDGLHAERRPQAHLHDAIRIERPLDEILV